MYAYAVIIISLIAVGFCWFVFDFAVQTVRAAILPAMPNNTASAFTLADTFMVNLWKYMLGFFIFGLILWVIVYAQRRGQPIYYEGY
jgi:glucan phosphoethanolaminetransferase (alkaline phosphatase superfamily)